MTSDGAEDGGAARLQLCISRAPRRVELAGSSLIKSRALQIGGVDSAGIGSRAGSYGSLQELDSEDDLPYLRSLDPRSWKEQDHYRVLGISRLRFNATDEQIKRAYRAKVLKHHPDKRKAKGESVNTDTDYFTCITRAYETLGNTVKRRSYDSVDPEFDDSLPSGSDLKRDFYATFAPYFESNARWSEKKNAPALGNESTPREDVEKFYNFWYEFESWREYSYLDEEEKEKGQDREERRWIEKQNRAVRAKKKKEEMSRIRTLVDLAYNNDPRIVKFKQEDKEKKIAQKKARQDAAQARKAEEEKQLERERLAKEQADREEKARADSARAEREALKKHVKKERKTFRDLCKSNNYYIANDDEMVEHMSAVEKICEVFSLLELQELNRALPEAGREKFVEAMNDTEAKLELERKAHVDSQKDSSKQSKVLTAGSPTWTQELVQLLIKSVNFFPAGTNQRWEVIANFVNQHGVFEDHKRFTAKDILSKAKDLQSSDFSKSSLKTAANREAFNRFEKDKRKPNSAIDDKEISVVFDSSKAAVNGTVGEGSAKSNPAQNGEPEPAKAKSVEKQTDKKEDAPWSKTEQELLEQAIKTYPVNTPERWDRIAECIPTRSKKECMKRFKELVDLVKAKKAAAQSVNR